MDRQAIPFRRDGFGRERSRDRRAWVRNWVESATTPLPALLPQGLPGCTLLVSPDSLYLCVPVAGAVPTQLAIPSAMTLATQVFDQQVVPVKIDVVGNRVALTSVSARPLTIGAF